MSGERQCSESTLFYDINNQQPVTGLGADVVPKWSQNVLRNHLGNKPEIPVRSIQCVLIEVNLKSVGTIQNSYTT